MYFYDVWYLIFCVPPLIFALIAGARVRSTYNKYSKVISSSGLVGANSAETVIRYNGVPMPSVVPIAGELTDNFNPKTNTIGLSQGVYGSRSVAAIGIAAHEAGHAVQYAKSYVPMKIRGKIIPFANIGSTAGIWLAIIGAFMAFNPLAYVGVGLYLFFVLFELITLPVELDASKRAIVALEQSGTLDGEELAGAKKVLRAAALTYVAALASAVGMLLRLLAIVGRSRRD